MPSTYQRMNYRVLSVLLVVALPALFLVGWIAVGLGQNQLRGVFGQLLAGVAERTAASVDAFVFRRTIDVAQLAEVSTLREAAAEAAAVPFDLAAIRQTDLEWQRSGVPEPFVFAVLENEASAFLRILVRNDPAHSEILLTDRQGRLAAASNVSTDYYQADEEWWLDVRNTGRLQMSDVQYDDSAQTYVIEISVPVYAPGTSEFAGVLKAATTSREMLSMISGTVLGETGEAVLIRRDGSTVYSRVGVDPGTSFFAADLLREALGLAGSAERTPGATPAATNRTTDPLFRTSFSALGPDGRQRLVAVAPTQLGITFPNLPWLVAVLQAEDELLAPMAAQLGFFGILLPLVALVTVALALWLSTRYAAPVLDPDTDMHLVDRPAVHQIDEESV